MKGKTAAKCIFSVVLIYYAIDKSTDTWDLIIFINTYRRATILKIVHQNDGFK